MEEKPDLMPKTDKTSPLDEPQKEIPADEDSVLSTAHSNVDHTDDASPESESSASKNTESSPITPDTTPAPDEIPMPSKSQDSLDEEVPTHEEPKQKSDDILSNLPNVPDDTPDAEHPIRELSDHPSNVAPSSLLPTEELPSPPSQESIFQESTSAMPLHEEITEDDHEEQLAHVDFDLLDAEGRWLIKVLSGPNTGAEFSLQSGTSYLIGSDPATCDIVFQDLSVSRQHARLTIDTKERAYVEDLGSKNSTFMDGDKITSKRQSIGSTLLSLGTTSFILADKEGERKTLVTPGLQKSDQKVDQAASPTSSGQAATPDSTKAAEGKIEAQKPLPESDRESTPLGPIHHAALPPLQSEIEKIKEEEKRQAKATHAISSLAILAVISGIILVIAVGTTFLFQTQEIEQPHASNAETLISKSLEDYPTVRYSFNPTNNRLLLVGHVLSTVDRSKLLDNLQQNKFISNIDFSNVVIDEFVWREINQVLIKNSAWKGITVSSPSAGKFVVSGFLRTRQQAEELYDYLSQNFAYTDLLEKRVIVEQDLLSQVTASLSEGGFRSVTATFSSGILALKGVIASGNQEKFNTLLAQFKAMPGVRGIELNVTSSPQQEAVVNITSKYPVTGYSIRGGSITVVINGKILARGDMLDGMQITEINPQAVYLEKEGVKYKIDFNK